MILAVLFCPETWKTDNSDRSNELLLTERGKHPYCKEKQFPEDFLASPWLGFPSAKQVGLTGLYMVGDSA